MYDPDDDACDYDDAVLDSSGGGTYDPYGEYLDPRDEELALEAWFDGHEASYGEDGGIWYDGYYCADATDLEEAEMEYWNTH